MFHFSRDCEELQALDLQKSENNVILVTIGLAYTARIETCDMEYFICIWNKRLERMAE